MGSEQANTPFSNFAEVAKQLVNSDVNPQCSTYCLQMDSSLFVYVKESFIRFYYLIKYVLSFSPNSQECLCIYSATGYKNRINRD